MGVVGEGDHVTAMVKTALDLGYRHIDTVEYHLSSPSSIAMFSVRNPRRRLQAANYGEPTVYEGQRSHTRNDIHTLGNEQSVGRALKESRVPRDEIFLTTKLE